jgi:VWFA-related protein
MRDVPRLFAAIFIALPLAAQTPATQTAPAQRPPDAEVIHAGTQLILVDVVVQDVTGHPVHGLKRTDFTLTEDKTSQDVRNFEEHSALTPAPPGPAMKLPPGTFSNYTPTPPGGTLNVLLLDALNTPMASQSYVRYQLQQYVKNADPGTRIAIFGLNSRLIMLQGFSSDPETLKDAVEHKLLPRSSNLLDDPTGSGIDNSVSGQMTEAFGAASVSSSLAQFEAETQSFQIQLRQQYTLDAFNVLARYLSAFPGRKNVIWFSGAFPLNILPDATLADPFAVVASAEDEYRDTTNLLARAQVAVYPIDARGLQTDPTFSATQSGRGMTAQTLSAKSAKFFQSQAEEHMTMDAMASDTGGHAFYNTNGLAQAVSKAIESGSNYYTLTYTPSNHKWTGSYRNIRVSLNGAYAAQGYKLAYRQGYWADDPTKPRDALKSAAVTEASSAATHSASFYAQASMARGAPLPQDILFKVRVLPASTTAEDALAPGNDPGSIKPIKGPFRRFLVDFAALAGSLTLLPQTDGTYKGAVEFSAYLYDPDCKLLNVTGKTISLNLTADEYAHFLEGAHKGAGVAAHLEISVPVKQESYLRIGIHDLPSNHIGAVEVPVASVSRLPPPPSAPPAATPAAAPATTQPATP